MATQTARRLTAIRFDWGKYRRVNYHCRLCPEKARPNFGDPDALLLDPRLKRVREKEFAHWLQAIVTHVLMHHPYEGEKNLNDFLIAIYS